MLEGAWCLRQLVERVATLVRVPGEHRAYHLRQHLGHEGGHGARRVEAIYNVLELETLLLASQKYDNKNRAKPPVHACTAADRRRALALQ